MHPIPGNFRSVAAALAVALISAVITAGCATSGTTPTTSATGTGTAPAAPGKAPVAQQGAQLWTQNCGHCHNIRPADSYSNAQWDVAMLHMRIRANLTANESRQILAFLRTAH